MSRVSTAPGFGLWILDFWLLLLDSEKRLTVFNGLRVLNVYLDDFAGRLRLNLVHQFHRFDNAHDGVWSDLTTDAYKAFRRRGCRPIKSSDNRGGNNMQVLIFRGGFFRLSARVPRRGRASTLHGAGRLSPRRRGVLLFRKQRRQSSSVFNGCSPTNPHPKPLAFQFKIRQTVFGNEVD